MNRKNWQLEYFPHTNTCGQDGKPCLQAKCKYWLEEKKCWDREFDTMVEETFNIEYGGDYIHYRDETGRTLNGLEHLHFNMQVVDKETFSEPIKATAHIRFNSRRLTKKVQEKFKLYDWTIDSCCEDGGDDHDLVFVIDANPKNKEKILDLFNFITRIIPEIVHYEQFVNTCDLCKDKCMSLTNFGKRAICGSCELKIINENLENYFKM
jgi:hypothetical protein